MNRFINERKNNWQRLEDLLSLIEGVSLRGLSRAEVREFGELYRRAATDLAIARAETRDPKLINYLNSLVIRAHGKIYRTESQSFGLILNFFGKDLPQTFRRNANYFLLAFAIFTSFAVASFLLCYYNGSFADELGLHRIRSAAQNDFRWWQNLNDMNQIGASLILTNNIQVSFLAFALGVLFGVGTFYILGYNGLFIGGTLGVCYKENPAFANELINFMIGHGVLELSCIFMAGGAGMMIGYTLVNPGDLTRSQALKKKGLEASRIVIGCAVLLVVAGVIEGFLSPAALPASVKWGTGILTGIALFSYLLLVAREKHKQ
jgi:uncharacterized membrane protein SpoIIM required for sporulation